MRLPPPASSVSVGWEDGSAKDIKVYRTALGKGQILVTGYYGGGSKVFLFPRLALVGFTEANEPLHRDSNKSLVCSGWSCRFHPGIEDYRSVLAGNVSDRWTKKGKEEEMAALSKVLTSNAEDGWRLHSVQPVPVFGGFSNKQTGVVLLAVFERD